MEGRRLTTNVSALGGIPQFLMTAAEVKLALDVIDTCDLCRGQDDEKFITYILTKKGKIMDASGTCI